MPVKKLILVFIACFAGWMSPVWAQNTASLPGVMLDMGDGGVIQKSVKSWASRKFEGIVPQGMDYSCGASALATVLKYGLGRNATTEADVVNGMLTDENRDIVLQRGFSMLDMKTYVESIGLKASGFKVDVSKLFDLKIPVVTLINQNGISHFVVIKKASEGRIYLADPALGHRIISVKEFEAIWPGLVLAVLSNEGFLANAEIMRGLSPALQWRTTVANGGTNFNGGEHVFFKVNQF
jgi:uncharacterized protein